jgi:NDP-sugar pyrophosphorylase family protein
MSALPVVQLLFPMGGLGTRFADTGIKTPKPLITVDGVPMIIKALQSFSRLHDRVDLIPIFVIRQEHEDEFKLSEKLLAVLPKARFTFLNRNTAGAVETCMEAAPLINPNAPIVVMDCDLYFRSTAYENELLTMCAGQIDGLLLYFESSNNRYSYAQLADDGKTVTRTAEKIPISRCALIGAYGFGSGQIFITAAKRLLEEPLNPMTGFKEYYVSLLFNFVLAEGRKVIAVPMDEFHSFGTPEELDCFVRGERSFKTE